MNFFSQVYSGRNEVWRWLVVIVIVITILYFNTDIISFQDVIFPAFLENSEYVFTPSSASIFKYYILFYIYLLIFIGLVYLLHKRDIRTFFSKYKKFRYIHFFLGMFIFSFYDLLVVSVSIVSSPGNYAFQFNLIPFLKLALVALLTIPVKAMFYELFYRAYILQFLSTLKFIDRKWMLILLSAFFFLIITLFVTMKVPLVDVTFHRILYILVAGLCLASLVLLTDGIEISLGVFFVNNFVSTVFISFKWFYLQTDSLFINTSETPDLLSTYYLGILSYIVYTIVVIKVFKIKNWKEKLLGRV